MQVEKKPYELLCRWDRDGSLQGAHVRWRYVIQEDDGTFIREQVDSAEPVDVGNGEGFPLGDIMPDVQAGAIMERDKALARQNDLEIEMGKLVDRLKEKERKSRQ